MKNNHLIYIVEDDPTVNSMLCLFLEKQGFTQVKGYFTAEEMLTELPLKKPVIIIQDFDLPGMNGIDVIRNVKLKYPNTEFIFLSGQKSIEIAVEAIKNGAFDYIVKDSFAKENVVTKINTLLKIKSLESEKKFFRVALIIFSILLICSWVLLVIHYFLKH
jgi:FixJ family two-component response regulator